MAQVVLGELIQSMLEASQKMRAKNPHKLLLMQAADVMLQMAEQISDMEEKKAHEQRIVLVN